MESYTRGRRGGAPDSDTDSISLTSTVEDGFTSDQEFVVDRILAEKEHDGNPYYLISWQDYPEEESTWEPEENIQDRTILAVWRVRKKKESKGIETPFDVARFEALAEKKMEERANRHKRRKAKRRRLGLSVSPSSSEDEEQISEPPVLDSSDEAEEVLEEPAPVDEPRSNMRSAARKLTHQGMFSTKPEQIGRSSALLESASSSSEDEPLEKVLKNIGSSQQKLQKESKKPSLSFEQDKAPPVIAKIKDSSSDTQPATAVVNQAQPASLAISSLKFKKKTRVTERSPPPKSDETESIEVNASTEDEHALKKGQQDQERGRRADRAARGGRSATRGGAAYRNVFIPSENSKSMKKDLLQIASDQTKKPTLFKNLHLLRKAELNGRAVADAAPDISALPGGLSDPSNPVDYSSLRPATLRKSSSSTSINKQSHEALGRREFDQSRVALQIYPVGDVVQTAEPAVESSDQGKTPLNYASYELSKRLRPSEMVCHYWASRNNCRRGYQCGYKHSFEGNSPVAPPPAIPAAKKPCKFWSTGQTCLEGDRCRWFHAAEMDYSQSSEAGEFAQPPDVREMPFHYAGSEAVEKARYGRRGQNVDEISMDTRVQGVFEPRDPETTQDISSASTGLQKSKSVRFSFHHTTDIKDGSKSPLPTTGKPKSILQRKRSHIDSQVMDDSSADPSPSQGHHQPDTEGYFPDVTMTDVSFSESPAQSPGSLQSILSEPKRAKTMSIQDYRRKSSLKAAENRSKSVRFGSAAEEVIELDFGDFGKASEEPWAKEFAALEGLGFSQSCTALDFQTLITPSQGRVFWHGSVRVNPTNSAVIERVVQQLQLGSAGLLCVTPTLMILAYPAKWEDWRYLSGPANLPPDARLGYVIFEGTTDLRDHILQLVHSNKIPTLPSGGSRYKKALVGVIHGLHIQTLLTSAPKGTNLYNFILVFPSPARALEDFLTSWLRSSKENCNVYSASTECAWLSFVNDSEIKAGVVLIHESAVPSIDELPYLSRLILTTRFINFWSISDPANAKICRSLPLEDNSFGKISATRLFPLGGAVFLTPSFLVAEPEKAHQFFKWLQNKLKVTLGTWKIVCCYNLRDYLLDLACEKAVERDDFYEIHKDKPAKDALAIKEGLSYQTCEARFAIHQDFIKVLAADTDDTFDENNPREETSPVVYADSSIDPDDEKALVTWYAAWAMTRLDQFRRFYVLGTNSKNAERAVRMKAVSPKSKENTPQVDETTQRRNSQMQKALAVVAKLNAIAPNAVNSPSNSSAPQSPRENREGPGKTPQAVPTEDSLSSIERRLAHQDISKESDSPTTENDSGKAWQTKSPPNITSDHSLKSIGTHLEKDSRTMTDQSPEMMEDVQMNGGIQETQNTNQNQLLHTTEKAKTPIKFEATSAWYSRLRSGGTKWEHLLFESWEKCFEQLGVKKG